MRKKDKQTSSEQKKISFRKLAYQALPEMWSFQLLVALLLAIPSTVIPMLINMVVEFRSTALTTANLKEYLLSWRAPIILILAVLLIFCYVVLELFSQIHLTHDILTGQRAGIRKDVSAGFRSLGRFLNPSGALVLLYIFIAVPLCGLGFSISLSKSFYIPDFIMSFITNSPPLLIGYIAGMIALIIAGYHSIFVMHAVLLDGMTPAEGRAFSNRIIRENQKAFLLGIGKTLLVIFLIQYAASFLFSSLPEMSLNSMGEDLPKNYTINFLQMVENAESFSDTDAMVVAYRIISAFTVLTGSYLITITRLLCASYLMLRMTRFYMEFTKGKTKEWPERPKKSHYRSKVLMIIIIFLICIFLSFIIGIFYNTLFDRDEPVKIVAHRAGGTMASENSVEGLYAAIEHNCYGSEIDTQRTKDGYYIINHDNNFKRLTGVAKASQDMTLEEIQQLRILDTSGSGREIPVATLEEMLDVIKGHEVLFIELKGATADRQMADDVVRLVREKDCVEDVVLISLNSDVISYAETTYPEFETGVLFFAGLGDVSRLNCDLLIMEEEMSSNSRIAQIHAAGKKAIVWTVNSEDSLYNFLNSSADAIITDEVELAQKVQDDLNNRTDFKVIQDKFNDFWD